MGQDYEAEVEESGSPTSDGSRSTASGRCTPLTSRPGIGANRKSMGDGKIGGEDSGGSDKEKGPSEIYEEKDNRAGAVFGMDEGDPSGEHAGRPKKATKSIWMVVTTLPQRSHTPFTDRKLHLQQADTQSRALVLEILLDMS